MIEPIRCPFCRSADVETVSAWGGQLMTSQMRCRACNTHFEAVRDAFAAHEDQRRGREAGAAGPADARP